LKGWQKLRHKGKQENDVMQNLHDAIEEASIKDTDQARLKLMTLEKMCCPGANKSGSKSRLYKRTSEMILHTAAMKIQANWRGCQERKIAKAVRDAGKYVDPYLEQQ